jgi:hypothetical protein
MDIGNSLATTGAGGDWPEAMLDAIYVAATKMQRH